MKKSIFHEEMKNPKFKAVYDEVAAKLNIGEEIAMLRQKRRMTQLELAEKVHTSRTAIARYESGEYNSYNIHTLTRIARALHVNLKVSFAAH